MKSRLEIFEGLKTDNWYGQHWRKKQISAADEVLMKEFLTQHHNDDYNTFEFALNRWLLDKKKPKNYSLLWGCLGAVNTRWSNLQREQIGTLIAVTKKES